jgi:hypothetical protein
VIPTTGEQTMYRPTIFRALVPAVLGAALASGCSSGTEAGSVEPDVAKMVLTVAGGSPYTATDPAGFAGATAQVQLGLFTVSAAFFRANGSPETIVNSSDFELRVSNNAASQSCSPGLCFERTGAMKGSISRLEPGQSATFYFSLYHVSEGHTDFGPYPLTFQYVDAGGGGGGKGGTD